MTDTTARDRAPTRDVTPLVARAREAKALDLEHFAFLRGYGAADLVRDDVREELLGDLARHRGRTRAQVHASTECWRIVWRYLRDRERTALPPPDAVHDPFGDAL